jgi:hypothetical protein
MRRFFTVLTGIVLILGGFSAFIAGFLFRANIERLLNSQSIGTAFILGGIAATIYGAYLVIARPEPDDDNVYLDL